MKGTDAASSVGVIVGPVKLKSGIFLPVGIWKGIINDFHQLLKNALFQTVSV